MANLRYVLKDPSFKYFIIGLMMFVVITGGGIAVIKKIMTKSGGQIADATLQDNQSQSNKPNEVIVIDDSKPSQSTDAAPADQNKSTDVQVSTSIEKATPETAPSVTAPTELSRTGGNGLVMALGLSALTYAVVLALQKRQ